MEPRVIGRFAVVRELGRGGMGVVYEGYDPDLRRKVALKLLPAAYVGDDERRSRFLREARAAAAVTHPNVAAIHEVGEDAGSVYIAMELVEGDTLRAALSSGPMSVERTLAVAQAVARALAKAHDKGVVHRDLKPDNVMITTEGDVKVLDFGLAKVGDAETTHEAGTTSALEHQVTASGTTGEGRILGTPGYMSPEQAAGKIVDHRTDIFSLGVVLYELLTGKRPFVGDSAMEILASTLRDEPKKLAGLAPHASPELQAIVDRCLAKKPSERFESARELAAALASAPGRSGPRRTTQLAVVALACAALAALAWIRWGRPPATVVARTSDAAAPSPAGTGILDLPPPLACNEAAKQHYATGLRNFREGGWDGAYRSFERAAAADPSCAEVQLRLAQTRIYQSASSTHEAMAAAIANRSKMSARDQALLDALDPLLGHEPPDFAESSARFDALVARYPLDAEILHLASTAHGRPWTSVRDLSKRALEIDPNYADARQLFARALMELSDVQGATRELEECTRRTPGGTDCLRELTTIDIRFGTCRKLEQHALAWTARDQQSAYAPWFMALALAAQGSPADVVREQIDLAARIESPERRFTAPLHRSVHSIYFGDWTAGRAHLADLGALASSDRNLEPHLAHDLLKAELLLEAGDTREAGRIAADFAVRSRTWASSPSTGVTDAWSIRSGPMRLLAIRRQAGLARADDVRKEVEAWTAARRARMPARELWAVADAQFVETKDEARTALARRPPDDPSLPFATAGVDAIVGRALLLADRAADAVPVLERGVARCDALAHPIENARAQLLLGLAREAAGDVKNACAAFASVVARWSSPTLPSVTAAQARDRAKALACAL